MGRFLDRFAREEREDIEAAALEEEAVGLDAVERVLERAWGEGDDAPGDPPATPATPATTVRPVRPVRASRLPRLLLAAAVLLAAVLVLWDDGGDEPGEGRGDPADVVLGPGDDLTLDASALAADGRIAWGGTVAAGQRLVLRVVDPAVSGPASVLLEQTVTGDTWVDAAQAAGWRGTVVVQLDLVDGSRVVLASRSEEVDLGR